MLADWLARMISAKANNSSKGKKFYTILDNIANANGCGDMFDKVDKTIIAVKTFNQVIEFICKTGKFPSNYSTNDHEKYLSIWLTNKRSINKRNIDLSILDHLIKLATTAGYPNMFNSNWCDDLRK